MDFLLSRYRNLTALLVVIMAQLVLLAWQVKSDQDVRLIRVWAVTAVTPLARVLEFVRQHTIGAAQNYLVLVDVRQENKRLSDELGRLKIENQFLRNELGTAERAQALQAFQQRTPSRTLPARIIGTGTGANSRLVFIDQGSREGVMRGMAVVTPDGIVGKVLASYPTASQVLMITDVTFAAGVISEKSRVHGTLKGVGQNKVVVDYVQNEEKVEPGEMFYTSGDDRIFPKGMPVGRATVVRPGPTFKEIFLLPAAFQQGFEEVLVVIEGIHGDLPDAKTPAAPGVYILPPPASGQKSAPAPGSTPGTQSTPAPPAPSVLTEADRLRERYKRIGEAQGHSYGMPTGGRVPNFNLNPDAPKPRPAPSSGAPETGAESSRPPAAGTGQPGAVAGSTSPSGAAPRAVPPSSAAGSASGQVSRPTGSPGQVAAPRAPVLAPQSQPAPARPQPGPSTLLPQSAPSQTRTAPAR
jgi:rod shape-determining protein MreC